MRFALCLLVLVAVPRAVFADADCTTPCRAYLCPRPSDIGPLVEATVLGPQDFGYRVEITALHGATRQGLAVGDEVHLQPKFGLAFAAGDEVLAHTGVNVDEVVGFALVDAADRVSCVPLTYGNERFAIARTSLINAIEGGTCLQELESRGYETPSCDDIDEAGCAVGRGAGASGAALLLIAIGSVALARRRSSSHPQRTQRTR